MSVRDKVFLLLEGFFLPIIVIKMIMFINADPVDWVNLVIFAFAAVVGVYVTMDIIKRALDR